MRKGFRTLIRNEDGSVAVEASVVLPVLMLLALGVLQFGFVINMYMTATSAASAGLQTFAVMRGVSGSYNAAVAAAKNVASRAAWKVAAADIAVTLTVNGTTCTTDTGCDLALAAGGPPSTGGAGGTSEVNVSIACKGLKFLPALPVMCPVAAKLQGPVQ
jgi:Flp pilus assembly protein TadG